MARPCWPRCSRTWRRSASRSPASTPGAASLLEQLPFVEGYGVDLGLLIDVAEVAGTPAIAQVDLGPACHRNRRSTSSAPRPSSCCRRRSTGRACRRPGHPRPPGRDPLPVAFGELPPLAALVAEA